MLGRVVLLEVLLLVATTTTSSTLSPSLLLVCRRVLRHRRRRQSDRDPARRREGVIAHEGDTPDGNVYFIPLTVIDNPPDARVVVHEKHECVCQTAALP